MCDEYSLAVFQTCTMPNDDFIAFRADISSESVIQKVKNGDDVESVLHDSLIIKMIKAGGEIDNYDIGGMAELVGVEITEDNDDPLVDIDAAIEKNEDLMDMRSRIEEAIK